MTLTYLPALLPTCLLTRDVMRPRALLPGVRPINRMRLARTIHDHVTSTHHGFSRASLRALFRARVNVGGRVARVVDGAQVELRAAREVVWHRVAAFAAQQARLKRQLVRLGRQLQRREHWLVRAPVRPGLKQGEAAVGELHHRNGEIGVGVGVIVGACAGGINTIRIGDIVASRQRARLAPLDAHEEHVAPSQTGRLPSRHNGDHARCEIVSRE
eukprot:6214562-Pleurochrysis_carterae.AAC.2